MSDATKLSLSQILIRCVATDAEKSEIFQTAHTLMIRYKYDRALALLAIFREENPSSGLGHFLTSVAFFASNQFDLARLHLATAETLDRDLAHSQLPSDAIEEYRQTIDRSAAAGGLQAETLARYIAPDAEPSEIFKTAHALILRCKYEQALALLELVSEKRPSSTAAQFLTSVAFFALRRFDLASRHLGTAEMLNQHFSDLRVPSDILGEYRQVISKDAVKDPERLRELQLQPEIEEELSLRRYWMPYVNWLMEPKARMKSIETDGFGFRHTIGPRGEIFSVSDFQGPEYSALFGASTAFGVGSSGNDKTISSCLSGLGGGMPWLNFAIPASVIEYNLISALFLRPMRARPQAFVLFVGCNELWASLISSFAIPPFGVAPLVPNMLNAMNGDLHKWAPKIGLPLVDSMPANERDLELMCSRLEALLTKTLRNFSYLAKGCGAPLYYVLQPNAHWMSRRKLHPDEVAWFEKLQHHPNNGYNEIADVFTELFPWYRDMVARACAASDIPFFDCNAALDIAEHDGKALFCDRVHLTDEGYGLVSRLIFKEVLT